MILIVQGHFCHHVFYLPLAWINYTGGLSNEIINPYSLSLIFQHYDIFNFIHVLIVPHYFYPSLFIVQFAA